MKSLFIYSFLFLLFSCKEKKTLADTQVAAIKDSNTAKVATPPEEDYMKDVYVDRGDYTTKNYDITVKTKYTVPGTLQYDSSYYFEGNFLIVHNKTTNKTDTIKLESDDNHLFRLSIEDLADSLRWKPLLVALTWTGDSDMETTEFAGYKGDSLKSLFSLSSLVSIYRKDQWTLAGMTAGRDELVYSGQQDYPFTVSLKNYEVTDILPSKQEIGYPTITLEPIKGYRMLSAHDSIPYTIKKGVKLTVDTLYRSAGIVSLIIRDSVVIHARLEKVTDKLQVNAAG